MHKLERKKKILEVINEKGLMSISQIAKKLEVSSETIRKDLIELEKEEKLVKTHGGAYIQENYDHGISSDIRETLFKDEKRYIADIALEYINDKNCITLDASTTCIELAKKIIVKKLKLTIITNSLEIAKLCSMTNDIKLILLGGEYRKKSNSFIGVIAVESLMNYCSDISFLSYPKFDIEMGLGDNNMDELKLRNTMLKRSRKSILLMDHTKFEKGDAIVFSNILKPDLIITNKELEIEFKEKLESEGINVRF